MKQKMGALLSSNRVRMILTVAITAAIVTIIIGVGSAMAENDQKQKTAMISEKAAKEIALNKTDGGILESFKWDSDDGKSVFEVEIVKGGYEYDIKIDAGTGEIIGFDQEKIRQKEENKNKNTEQASNGSGSPQAAASGTSGSGNSGSSGGSSGTSDSDNNYIGKAKAKSIALGRVGGGTVVSCHLDYDDGRAEYDIEIHSGKYEYDLEIDAKTGKILDFDKDIQDKYEKDYDHDDHDDDDHDDDHDD